MKKLLTLSLALLLAFTQLFSVCVFAYTAEDAFYEFKETYPEFMAELATQNITDDLMVMFLYDIQAYMKELDNVNKITYENFEKNAISAINAVSAREQFLVLQDALIVLYPNAIKQAIINGTIAPEFVPLVNTIKAIVFEHDMLGSGAATPDGYNIVVKIKNLSETVTVSESYVLPQTLYAQTATGREIPVKVTWSGKINASKPGVYSVHGIITLPEGYEFSEGMTNGIDYTVIATEKTSQSKFTDISEAHWAYNSIVHLADNFIINGYLDGAFRPDNNITRGEFAKIIVSAMGKFDHTAQADFTDVSADSWYYPYIASAFKEGYITGYPDKTFAPEANITRADICTIVSRCLNNPLPDGSVAAFADDSSIPQYAHSAIYALAAKGIINGTGNNMFSPTAYATRAQTAKIIYGAFFQ